ncbi:L,D-transpeptidase family protein [Salinisphaera aquimarina]|uniref:L,D-transpeptidase family protein n=1 Tax=Salinisphaera aquimarina TaxID=2094031 RepID=A0ABV7ERC4_9GAMM
MNEDAVHIDIDLHAQRLVLLDGQDHEIKAYDVSTAAKGAGEFEGSHQTPRGAHRIRAKIGADAPVGTVFKGRRPTGEIYSPELAKAAPRTDWILSRILWLCGEEVGRNRLGGMDTMRRFIYIHGAADTAVMGKPGSIGCIRMTNSDVIDLFERVEAGTKVLIHE